MPTLVLESVSKSFGSGQSGLHETDLVLDSGLFMTILGASGSGKTTLLKLMNRLYAPTSGVIRLDGKDIAAIPVTELRRRMGYVIQQVGLFQHLSVAENIAIVPVLLKWPRARIARRVDELLHLVGLEPDAYRHRYPGQLSGGQQQRVGLARALAADPPILLMDEPFGALDPPTRQRLQDELLALQAKFRKTVLFVTHDVPEAFKLGDKVIIMKEGRIQQADAPSKILARPANAFVAHFIGADDPMRHFDWIRAREIMRTLPPSLQGKSSDWAFLTQAVPRVREDCALSEVWRQLFVSPSDYVLVKDEREQLIGQIALNDIQAWRQRRFPRSREMASCPF